MPGSVEDRLKKMIVERLFLKVTPAELAEDKSLVEAYGVDSVSVLELIVGLEEEFGITVADTDFRVENFETVAALARFVKERLERKENAAGSGPAQPS